MAKYLKKFNTHAEYEAYKASSDYNIWLNVSFCKDNNDVHYASPIMTFEDSEVKRICVENWGGLTGGSTNIPGPEGEITYEQAAKVTTVGTIFKGNTSITKFNELYFFENAALPSNCFMGCTSLTEATVPKKMKSLPTNAAFRNCTSLRKLYFGEGYTTLSYSSMEQCNNLALIMPTTFNSMGNYVFYTGSNYILVIKATTPPTINGTYGLNHLLKAYVPDDYVNDYKSATNWSSLASKIYPLSDYDGSIVSPVWEE